MLKGELSNQVTDTLIWVADQFTVNWHHVYEVYNMHPEATKPLTPDGVRSLLRRLTNQGYIRWKRLIAQKPSFVYVTPKTLMELNLPYPDYEPKITQFNASGVREGTTNMHKNQINQVRIYLEKQYGRRLGWVSERRLQLDEQPNRDGTYPHRVDGLIWLDNRDTAIEVERSKKGVQRLEQVMLDLMVAYDLTYYFCTQPETYGLAHRIARDVDPDRRHFRIVDWSEIA